MKYNIKLWPIDAEHLKNMLQTEEYFFRAVGNINLPPFETYSRTILL